jgi:hypothetical protein
MMVSTQTTLGRETTQPVLLARHAVVLSLFGGITALKIVAFMTLFRAGVAQPFVGTNAEVHYIPIADRLLSEGRFNGPESRTHSKVPPGYPAFLAVIKTIAPLSFLPATVCSHMLLDFLVAYLVFVVALRVHWPWLGTWAGLAWLLYPPEVICSTWITAEPLFTALLMFSMVTLLCSLNRRGFSLAFGAGLILGAATLVRGTCLWLPPFLLPLWFSRTVNRGLLKGAAFWAGMLCFVLPWMLRNQWVLGDPIMVSWGTGQIVLQGSDERVFTIEGGREYFPGMFEAADRAGIERPPAQGRRSEYDRWLMRVGLHNYKERLRERPLSFFPLAVHKFARLWYGTESGGMRQQAFLALCSVAVVPLGLWQLWRWRTSQPQLLWLLGLLVLYFILVHWITLPQFRYMLPIYPLLLLGMCQWVASWFERRDQIQAALPG